MASYRLCRTKVRDRQRSHGAERTHDIQMSRGAVHQYRMYGLFPIGDTVRSGGWYRQGRNLKRSL